MFATERTRRSWAMSRWMACAFAVSVVFVIASFVFGS